MTFSVTENVGGSFFVNVNRKITSNCFSADSFSGISFFNSGNLELGSSGSLLTKELGTCRLRALLFYHVPGESRGRHGEVNAAAAVRRSDAPLLQGEVTRDCGRVKYMVISGAIYLLKNIVANFRCDLFTFHVVQAMDRIMDY